MIYQICLQQGAPQASEQGLAGRVRSQLSGIRTVTVSAPGVLLEEWSPEELQVSPAFSSPRRPPYSLASDALASASQSVALLVSILSPIVCMLTCMF